jgi:hypothetical protein
MQEQLTAERLRAQSAEDKLNAAADMRGRVSYAVQKASDIFVTVHYRFDCANHGYQKCEITRVRLVITGDEPTDVVNPVPPSGFPQSIGHGESFRQEGHFSFSTVRADIIVRSSFKFILIDALEGEHGNITAIASS